MKKKKKPKTPDICKERNKLETCEYNWKAMGPGPATPEAAWEGAEKRPKDRAQGPVSPELRQAVFSLETGAQLSAGSSEDPMP